MVLLLLLASLVHADPGRERAWLKLLHYKGNSSQADGPAFFLSPQGKTDPQAELEADVAAFRLAEPDGAQCRFPARYKWLKKRLALDTADAPCPRFDEWRETIGAKSVTLVFADAFLNNPASMYGHTFLRLRKGAGSDPLLDYTINFAGNPDTNNALFYALRGIYGAFPGTYTTVPFYMKAQEYNNIESRDLWEYDLDLSTEAVDMLTRHAWEMGSTWFDYFFFSENCSYQLLTLLDAADPSLGLSDGFGFGTIPADTVRAALAKPGLVSAVRYRPSHMSELRARREHLPMEDRVWAEKVARGADPALIAALPKDRQARVLDSAYDYRRYLHGFSDLPPAEERPLLLARARLGQPQTPADAPVPPALEKGHDTARAGAGGGVNGRGPFEEVWFRAALHDLAGNPEGYQQGSELEMGALQARFDNRDHQPYIERLALVNIVSLSPLERWIKKPSWHVFAGVDQAKELGEAPQNSMALTVSPGFGGAARWKWATLYVFADAELTQAAKLAQDWRFGGGPSAGLLLRPFSWWRLHAQASYREYAQRSPHSERLKVTSAWTLARDWELRVTLDRRTPDKEAGAALLRYF